jgi:hypothetical protein
VTGPFHDPDTGEFDARRFLADMERMKEITDRRPKRTDVAQGIGRLCADLEAELGRPLSPAVGSLAWLDSERRDVSLVATVTGGNLIVGCLDPLAHSVVDHLTALGEVLPNAALMRSPLTLARASMEAATIAWHLSDRNVEGSERLRRAVNLRLARIEEERRQASTLGPDAQEAATGALADLQRVATEAGMSVSVPKREMPHVPPKITTQGMIKELFQGEGMGPYVWRELSSVAHSRLHSGDLDWFELSHDLLGGLPDWDIARRTFPAIFAVAAMIDRLVEYLGVELDSAQVDSRLLFEVWAMAGDLKPTPT